MAQDSRLSFLSFLNNPRGRLAQGTNAQVGRIGTAFAIAVVHEDSLATGTLARFPDFEVAGPVERIPSTSSNGIHRLPMIFRERR